MSELSLADLLMQRADLWARGERDNNQSVPGGILRHIDEAGKFRLPQIKAIEMHLWMKFAANNKSLADIVIAGLLDDPHLAEKYRYQKRLDLSSTRQFFIAFAEENRLPDLSRMARDEPKTDEEWEGWLRELLRDYPYPNRIYSLPMGAGKTYLMASFIYLDLYFSHLMPEVQSFAHNFVVLAPHAAKTAILPSLKTIREFDPNWILPPAAAKQVSSEIRIEVLDSPKSASKSMRVENPNLDRVNRLSQTHERGLVFITNAEKVVLEKLDPSDPNAYPLDGKSQEEIRRHNELRDAMADLPALSVFLDEAHHTYTTVTEAQERKLRQAVEVLASKGNLREVNGFSGTPFINTKLDIAGIRVRLSQLQDVVYHFPLARGIGQFLKTPKVKFKEEVREEQFISETLTDFFTDYDIEYADGTCSKLAIYCPSVAVLNQEILPMVKNWYATHRQGKEDEEVFSYYTADKEFRLPATALAEFHNLDSPHSRKRVILLVAVGREGWDCHSLTAVALPRHTTTRNFVLQTSCRCLREVSDADQERALIVLGTGNYKLLQDQLESVHKMTIDEFQSHLFNSVPVFRRKPNLGTLKYKQIDSRCIIETNEVHNDPKAELEKFSTEYFMTLPEYAYQQRKGEGQINQAGSMISHHYSILTIGGDDPLQRYEEFLMTLQQALWGRYHAAELNQHYGDQLQQLYQQYQKNSDWFAKHPQSSVNICHAWVKAIAACFAAECKYRREELLKDTTIDLLEWQGDNPTIPWKGTNFLPALDGSRRGRERLHKHPERMEEDLEDAGHDPQDISFNYVPYRLDSGFEESAILRMLQEQQLSELELYYNGMTDINLDSFNIQTPAGRYTPDFLLLQRRGGEKYQKGKKGNQAPIERILIIETKGKPFYDEAFKTKERFVQNAFVRHNPQFRYIKILDDDDSGDFERHIGGLRDKVTQWLEGTL